MTSVSYKHVFCYFLFLLCHNYVPILTHLPLQPSAARLVPTFEYVCTPMLCSTVHGCLSYEHVCMVLLQTIGYDPVLGAEESRKFGVESMALEELWPRADYITLHTPLIPQTKREQQHLLSAFTAVRWLRSLRDKLVWFSSIEQCLLITASASLGYVLSHWAHFTVPRFLLFMFVFFCELIVSYCICVVLL